MRAALTLVLCLWAWPLAADALIARLSEATQAARLFDILAREAERSGQDVDADFLDGQGGAVYADTVARINDPARLLARFETEMRAGLDDETLRTVLAFYESDLGQQVVDLELAAREAFYDPEVELMVRARVAGNGPPELVARFIEVGDLVERNVTDGLKSLRQFYLGRLEGGATDMSRADIDSFMVETEDWLRDDTREWLEGYLTLAYSPLGHDALEAYVALWEEPPWQVYDDALFAAFAAIFEETSFAHGQLVGRLSDVNEI